MRVDTLKPKKPKRGMYICRQNLCTGSLGQPGRFAGAEILISVFYNKVNTYGEMFGYADHRCNVKITWGLCGLNS